MIDIIPYFQDILDRKKIEVRVAKVKGAPIRNQMDQLKEIFAKTMATDVPGALSFSRLASHNRQIVLETTSRKAVATFCDKVTQQFFYLFFFVFIYYSVIKLFLFFQRFYAICRNHSYAYRPGMPENADCPHPVECLFQSKMFNLLYNKQ